jgi:hypothetical protein
MAEGVPEPGTPAADGTAEAAAGDAQGNGAADPSDFKSRFINGGEWAWEEFQKVQSQKDKSFSKLENAKLAVEIAEVLGNGDIQAGSQAALEQLQVYQRAVQDPAMKKVLDHFSQTGTVPGHGDLGGDVSEEDYVEPAVKALQDQVAQLTQTVTGLSGQTAEQGFKGALDSYFTEGDGQWLDPAERKGLFTDIEDRVRRAGRPLTTAEVELLSTEYLRRNDLVVKIGERMHLQKLRRRGEAATDVPSSVGPSGVDDLLPPSAFKDKSASEALAYARNKFGS